ncbi:MAG: aminoacyl-tRNA hydrolase [Planctomycetota bacterium]
MGNIGRQYDGTRHNVGFQLTALLAERYATDTARLKFDGAIREIRLGGDKVLLLEPHTLMNRSGQSVRKAVDFYKLEPADLMVVCDDFHLEVGTLRIRAKGSDGGQKGLADVIQKMGTNEVPRMRIGVGPVPERWSNIDFVLGKFTPDESAEVAATLRRAVDGLEAWVAEGIEAAMNRVNGGPVSGSPDNK